MKSKHFIIIFVLVGLMLLNGCKIMNQPTVTLEDKNETSQPTKPIVALKNLDVSSTLSMGIRNPKTLNPLLNRDASVQVPLALMYEGLIAVNSSKEIIYELAESITFDNDYLVIHVNLREDKMFTSEKVVTSSDVEYTINYIKSHPESPYFGQVSKIASVKRQGTNSLDLTFLQSSYYNLYALDFPIINKSLIDEKNDFIADGTGPFTLELYKNMNAMILVRKAPSQTGINRIEFKVYREESIEYNAFTHRMSDVTIPSQYNWNGYIEEGDLQNIEYTSNAFTMIMINTKDPLLSNKELRKAISLGINQYQMVNELFLNHAAYSPVPIHPNAYYSEIVDDGFNSNLAMQKSKSVLTRVGQPSYELSMIVPENNINMDKIARMIKAQLLKADIHIHITYLSKEDYLNRLISNNYQLALTQMNMSESNDLTNLLSTNGIQIGLNYMQYSSVKMDLLLERFNRIISEEQIIQTYSEITQCILEDVPLIGLFYMNNTVLSHYDLKSIIEPTQMNKLNEIIKEN